MAPAPLLAPEAPGGGEGGEECAAEDIVQLRARAASLAESAAAVPGVRWSESGRWQVRRLSLSLEGFHALRCAVGTIPLRVTHRRVCRRRPQSSGALNLQWCLAWLPRAVFN